MCVSVCHLPLLYLTDDQLCGRSAAGELTLDSWVSLLVIVYERVCDVLQAKIPEFQQAIGEHHSIVDLICLAYSPIKINREKVIVDENQRLDIVPSSYNYSTIPVLPRPAHGSN